MWLKCHWEVSPEKSKVGWLRISSSLLLKPQWIMYARNGCFSFRFQCRFKGGLYRAHQGTHCLNTAHWVERCWTFWKGKCHSLAVVKHIYVPWQYSNCGASHSDKGCVHLYLSFQIPSTASSLLSKPSSLGNTCATSTWLTQGERSCDLSWGQGAQLRQEEETLVPVLHRHLECPPAWCHEGFQWRTAQLPPCRTPPGAGDSASFPLGRLGQRWTRE